MENKGNSVFEKLDDQGKKIDDISDKLKDINENDLFALAKRCWNYRDYKSAQKYFTQISLINPLNWEASLYASLCNFKGMFTVNYIVTFPSQVEKIVISTIDYINELLLSKKEKEIEIGKLFNIIKEYIEPDVTCYERNKKTYKDYDKTYPLSLELYIYNIYKKFDSLDYINSKEYSNFFIDQISKVIIISDVVLDEIDKTTMKEIQSRISKKVNLDSLDKGANFKSDQTSQNKHKNKNKDNKILCLEYKNKKKGKFYNFVDIIGGTLLVLLSILGLVFIFTKDRNIYHLVFFILNLISGIFLLLKGINQRKIIKIKSIFYIRNIFNLYNEKGPHEVMKNRIHFSMFCLWYQAILLTWTIMNLILEFTNRKIDINFIILSICYLLIILIISITYLKKGEARLFYLQNDKKQYLD